MNGSHAVDTVPNGSVNGQVTNIYSASSLSQIKATLAQLNEREAAVTTKLDELLSSQKDLSRELGRLDLLRAHLGSQVVNTRAISNGMLSSAASTAHRISGAVKRLDQEQSNVKATLAVVEQVAELKACVLGVHDSMGAPQDWETAAGYLSRAAAVPESIVNSSFAEEIVPTAEVPDPPRVTLDVASESLCGLFLREFEKATSDGDGARVTRFFKLFPLIGRSEVGLDAYSRYVCTGVAARARQNLDSGARSGRGDGMVYAGNLSKLFEHIAQIIDGHQPLVERHYGERKMNRVIERLQVEADVQGGILLDTWGDERSVDRKLTDVKSYAFTFLVQSFLPAAKPAAGTPRSGSPAVNGPAGRSSEDEGIDMKEIDAILSECALMLSRWGLYSRFVATKYGSVEEDRTGKEVLIVPHFINDSNLQKKVSKTLTDSFTALTTFFLRRSVEKAFQLDEAPSGLNLNLSKPLSANPPFMSSAVDDVMYIVNQVLQRSISTAQRTVVDNVIPTVGRVLSGEFIGMIQRKMRDESFPKAAIQGTMPPEDKRIQFMVLLNNLDISIGYFKRIVSGYLPSPNRSTTESNLTELFPFGNDAQIVENLLRNVEHGFVAKTSELIHDAINVLHMQVIHPRLRAIMNDTFRDVDYVSETDDGPTGGRGGDEAHDDQEDLVKNRFDKLWNGLMRPMKRILTDANYARLQATAVDQLSRSLERRIWSLQDRVSDLGAVRLERDIAGIVTAAVGGGKYELRDNFQRCVQICLVMNMEDDEWEELAQQEEEDGSWKLDAAERRRARAVVRIA